MEQEKFYRAANLVQGIASLAVVGTNEVCQQLVSWDVIENRLAYGYLTDIFAVPLISGALNVKAKNPYAPAVVATFYSGLEMTRLVGWFDPYDVVAYWAGAGIAYGVNKLGESKKVRELFEAANPFKKKRLEDLSESEEHVPKV